MEKDLHQDGEACHTKVPNEKEAKEEVKETTKRNDTGQFDKGETPKFSYQSKLSEFIEWLQDLFKMRQVVPIMTYDAAMKYFITDRPDPKIKKGAILKQKHSQGIHLWQVFLNENNELVLGSDQIPYGRQLVARKMDEELSTTFGKNDLIIVE